MKKKLIQLSHSQMEQSGTCPLSYRFTVEGYGADVTPPPLTGEGTEDHRRIENAVKARLKYWIPPPETDQSPHTDITYLHGALLETRLSVELEELGVKFVGVIDALLPGLTVDFKNAGSPALKDSHRRQFDRYEVLKMVNHPELMDDKGGDTTEIFFLQHNSPRTIVHRYSIEDLPALRIALVEDARKCLEIRDRPVGDCRPRPDWLCNYCAYPLRCAKAGGISGDMATLLTNPEGRTKLVERLAIVGAEYDGIRRMLSGFVDTNGPIEFPDGRKWGKNHARSKRLNQSDLFKLGCKCTKHECLPWVMLSMSPDLDNAERLAKGNKSVLESLARAGYKPEKIKAMVEEAQNLISIEEGRVYYGFLK